MKTEFEDNRLTISEIDFIKVDDSEHGKRRAKMGRDTMIDFYSLQKIAKDYGFNIPNEAFIFCYEAWRSDYKSNYNHNGTCVYSACGCNSLVFSVYFGDNETYVA